jgi:hypothetical protein
MAEARCRQQWQHTSMLCAVIANANPYRKGKPARPADFDPYERVKQKPRQKLMVGIDVLQMIFCGPPPKPTATTPTPTP